MKRILIFAYGSLTYVLFLGVFLYAVGFLGNVAVPKSIDSGAPAPLGEALLVNGLLLGVFAVQHSVMARPAFKRMLPRMIPEPAERSTYVLASNLALILLFWQWRPMGGIVWDLESPLARGLAWSVFGFGWLTVLVTTFLINHFDLFGMRQVWLFLRGREYTPLKFTMPGPYRHVRHPLYVGWLCAFWGTPTMTAAHLAFAVATTAYILAAIQFEERDLIDAHGEAYADYRRTVPMLIPRLTRSVRGSSQVASRESSTVAS